MDSRERFLRALRRQEADRIPIHDNPWSSVVTRWHHEGLPDEITPDEYFGYEMIQVVADLTPRFPVRLVEQNEKYILETTSEGGMRKNLRDYSATPEVVDWPIKDESDWERIKARLVPDYTRIDWVTLHNTYHRARSQGKFIAFCGGFGYDVTQSYIKSEELLVLMVTDPDWIKDIFVTQAHLLIETARMIFEKGYTCDGAYLYDDRGYRNGLLFSPNTYRELLFEVDKMFCDFFHSYDMPVILHSDGNVSELIPHLIDAGFDCLQPLEVKAGMDVVELKEKYGDKLSFMGGIDARAMADPDPSKIEEEIKRKIPAAKVGGGYIYHSDHSVPKNVSFQQYKRVIELVHEYGRY